MSLTTLRMTLLVGLLSFAFSFCQKSNLAIPNIYDPNHRDTTQVIPKDSSSNKPDTTVTTPKDTTLNRDTTVVTPPVTPPVVVPPVTPPVEPPVTPPSGTVITVGTGSGDLLIDGTGKTYGCNTLIKIKAGTYGTIEIKNVQGTDGCPVAIKNGGQVYITSSMNTDNIKNVIISGDNTAGITYGFKFINIYYRAIVMNGNITGITLKSMSFKNVNNYCISGNGTNGDKLPYDGTANTTNKGFKILNCEFDNAGSVAFGGNLNKDNSEDSGLFKDLEIAYNTFKNTDAGSLCSFTNVQDYNIHHNVVDNVNYTNNMHNGIFFMQGNGQFHHNKLTNYQGNAIRAWAYSRGSTPATIEIHDNICYNTRKYSGFEIQSFARNMWPGKSTYVNAKVYNNTVGKMNTSHDWEGLILDLYDLIGGSIEYYNNMGFDLYSTRTITDMINLGGPPFTRKENNIYKSTWQEAVTDLTAFASKLIGTGSN